MRGLPPSSFPSLDSCDEFLGKTGTDEEIRKTLFDMAPLKALDSYGFHALFFHKVWV